MIGGDTEAAISSILDIIPLLEEVNFKKIVKNKSFKKAIKEQLKNLDSSSAKRKIKSEPIEENHIKNKKRKTS